MMMMPCCSGSNRLKYQKLVLITFLIIKFAKFTRKDNSQVVDKYGWQYMARFASLHMDSIFVRGTQAPPEFVGNGSAWATMTSAGALIPAPGASMIFLIPRRDPFTIWAQQAAIFKQTKRPEAAKLYMNWQLSKEFQVSVKIM
jgi:ABC-type Fe3+ transport system substrate-binding protein